MTVTLDDLRAQFEAARDQAQLPKDRWLFSHRMKGAGWPSVLDTIEQAAQADEWIYLEPLCHQSGRDRMVVEAIRLARRYIIARDFNVLDPDQADMLWKLQNGGAL